MLSTYYYLAEFAYLLCYSMLFLELKYQTKLNVFNPQKLIELYLKIY